MRICSLLPSITEILFELGLGECVVGVTHECDWPPEALSKSQLTSSRIETENCSSAEIDAQVRIDPGSLYNLDVSSLEKLKPDLILTQSLCPVCAVDESLVRRVTESMPSRPRVRAFHPTCLADVLAMIREIGELTGCPSAASRLVLRFDGELDRVRAAVSGTGHRARVVCLEWTDPLFACGHWTPELVGIAAGDECLGRVGQMSRPVTWKELCSADPDVLVVAPCGLNLERTMQELSGLGQQVGWDKLRAPGSGQVFGCDGSAYFNRPGPRLVETLHILAEVLHPSIFAGLAPAQSFQQVHALSRTRG
jgi:iron complex transport system substrate-binding protein